MPPVPSFVLTKVLTCATASMAYLGVGVGIGALAGAAFMALRRRRGQDPEVYMAPTEGNKVRVCFSRLPTTQRAFKSAGA